MGSRSLRNSFIYLLALVLIVAVFLTLFRSNKSSSNTDISTVIQMAKDNQLQKITVKGDSLTVLTKSGQKLKSRKEPSASMEQLLNKDGVTTGPNGVDLAVSAPSSWGNWASLFFSFLPLIIFGALIIFMMRRAQGTNNQALTFGRSRARMFTGNMPAMTFADVAGVDEAKQELQEVVEFLRYPEKFSALGARIPRGVLLIGPPGTGKTLLGRAVAGEAGVPFFSISGSEFVEMFVGVGASRVRDLFDQAKRNAPCIVFVDEIDAVGRQRGAGLGGGNDEREQTLNQILVEMDGFETGTNVIVLAATNRPDVLDPALLRPGRFDRQVVLDRPDIAGRKAILEVHARGKPLDTDISLNTIAQITPGFSGADLANLINEAAILAARRSKKKIGSEEFNEAVDRVIAGPERRSRLISPREKEITAYHEAGHALVARVLPNADRVHKISIIARGMTGGFTRILPTEDRYLWTRGQLNDMLAASLGGRAAEKIVFGEMTTGSGSDIEQATKIARSMVMEYGMSERLGPRSFGHKEELVFLGREISEHKNYSEKVAKEIDEEIYGIIDTAYQRANSLLSARRGKLRQIAERLISDETLEGEPLQELFNAPEPQGIPSPAR